MAGRLSVLIAQRRCSLVFASVKSVRGAASASTTRRQVRVLLTIALCPAFVLTLQEGPLLHVHEQVHAPGHVRAWHRQVLGAHTHWSAHSRRSRKDAPQLEKADDNESVVSVPFFRSESPKASVQPALIRTCPLTRCPDLRAPSPLAFYWPPRRSVALPRSVRKQRSSKGSLRRAHEHISSVRSKLPRTTIQKLLLAPGYARQD
jgi:hypothetical protein